MKWKLGLLVSFVAVVLAAQAQPQPANQNRSGQKTEKGTPLQQVVQDLAKTYSVKLLCDPFVQQTRIEPPTAENLEGALDEVVKQIPGLTWRKVYLKKETSGYEPSADKIIASVRSMLTIELSGVMVVDAKTDKLNSFLRDWPVTPQFEQSLTTMQPPYNAEPYYVIVNPRPGLIAGTPGNMAIDQYVAQQQQMMEMLMKMSPEDRQKAMRAGMDLWMNMDPSLRNQMMMEGMRMGMEWWRSMPEDQRQQMIEQSMSMFQEMMGGGPPPGGRP